MRRVVAALLLGGSLLALPACGNGGTDEASRAAGIVPVDALGLISVNLDPSIDQKRNLLGIVRRFPDARDEVKGEFDEARDDLLAKMLEESGLDFQRDVKPWLGDEVALAILPPGKDDEGPPVLAMVETDDAAKAKAAIEKVRKDGDFQGAYAVVGDFVVISDQDGEADDAQSLARITAQSKKDDGGLADSKEFTDVVADLHGDRLFLAWVDLKDGLALAEKLGALPGLKLLERFGNRAVPVAFDLHAEGKALVFQGVAPATVKDGGGEAELTRSLPADTLAALTAFDFGQGLRDGLDAALGADGGEGDFFGAIERQLGVSLENDLLSWMQGELILTVGAPPDGQPFPDFALVVEPSDRAKARAGMDKIRDAVRARNIPLEEREVAGAKAYVAPAFTEGAQPAMALFPDRFVLANRPGYLEQLAKGHDPGLAGTGAYRSVVEDDGSEHTTFQFVVLIDPIREALEKAILEDPEDRAEYERDTKPNVEPLAAFGVVSRRDGDVDRVEVKLTFD